MARAQVRVGRQGLTGGMPGMGCVADARIRMGRAGMEGGCVEPGCLAARGAVRWTRAVAGKSGRWNLPGELAGELAWGDGRGRPQEEVGGAGRAGRSRAPARSRCPGEGQRLSACQMAAQGPAWFMV